MYQKPRTIRSVLLAGVLILSLILGACGVDDVSPTAQSTSPTVQTTQPESSQQDTQPETTAPTLPQGSELQVRFWMWGRRMRPLSAAMGTICLLTAATGEIPT